MVSSGRCSVIPGRSTPFQVQFSRILGPGPGDRHGGGAMGRVHVRAQGAVPPERFVAALTDFGPGREEIWGNSDPQHFVVHDQGATWAEVTEGSATGGVWQRLRYDWSVP